MKVIRAAEMGMCFGVRDALRTTEMVSDPRQVTIHGELVHNAEVSAGLAARGFRQAAETRRSALPLTPLVLITAHGISDAERRRLQAGDKQLIDTTCPLVKRVHEAAQELAADKRHVLVIGKQGHVEVQGIVEDLRSCDVIGAAGEVRCYGQPRLGVVCQTTVAPDDAAEICEQIARLNPRADIRIADTICQPTRLRQRALVDLLARVDAVVVVGGRNSNNTRQLVRLCRTQAMRVLHVERADELDSDWFSGVETVGLTAGTSTLDGTIDAVEAALERMDAGGDNFRSAREWRLYFEHNAGSLLDIPWELGAELTPAETAAIADSLAEFQAGESSEGKHLLRCAAEYAARTGDQEYVRAVRLFIGEEQRHARDLALFLTLNHIPLVKTTFTDRVFRKLRHSCGGLEVSIAVLITAEIISQVYYAALREATGSLILRRLCDQLLSDEVRHVEFQAGQLAKLRGGRTLTGAWATMGLQRFLFLGTTFVVWFVHRRALRRGGLSAWGWWQACWRAFHDAFAAGEANATEQSSQELTLPALPPRGLLRRQDSQA